MSIRYTSERVRPAEWVLPGHPDKLADAIADRLVEVGSIDIFPPRLSAIEVAIHRDTVYLTGRSTLGEVPGLDHIDELKRFVRETVGAAGYTDGAYWKPYGSEFRVEGNLCLDHFHEGEVASRHLSDDQCIITGYAIDFPGTSYLPPEHWFARTLAKSLYEEVSSYLQLCPDGKVLVQLRQTGVGAQTVYELDKVSASLLVPDGVTDVGLRRVFLSHLEETLVKAREAFNCSARIPNPERIIINGSGNYHVGGPEGDNGLSGKKLLLDFYGPRVPIGGGALCGKDLKKPDRAGAYIARRLALELVKLGVADEVLVTGTVVPGAEHFEVSSIQTPKGWLHNPRQFETLVDTCLDNVFTSSLCERLVEGSRWGYWFDPACNGEAI